MIAQGRVENGVVIFAEGVHFPEGQLVTVQPVAKLDVRGEAITPERQAALRQLIGLWTMDQPPNDEQTESLRERELLKKYG